MGIGINHGHRDSSFFTLNVNKIVQSSRVQRFKVRSETSQGDTDKQVAAIARRRAAVIVIVKGVLCYDVSRFNQMTYSIQATHLRTSTLNFEHGTLNFATS
jgi:hypothetical protein